MTRNWHALYGRVGDFNALIEENVGGIRVAQAFANEEHERRLFARDDQGYRTTKLEAYRIMATATLLSYLSMRLIQMVVMVAGSYLVIWDELMSSSMRRRRPSTSRRSAPSRRRWRSFRKAV